MCCLISSGVMQHEFTVCVCVCEVTGCVVESVQPAGPRRLLSSCLQPSSHWTALPVIPPFQFLFPVLTVSQSLRPKLSVSPSRRACARPPAWRKADGVWKALRSDAACVPLADGRRNSQLWTFLVCLKWSLLSVVCSFLCDATRGSSWLRRLLIHMP